MKSPGRTSTAVTEVAVEWFLKIRAVEDPPAELVQEWMAWLAASEDHRRAFEQVTQLWHGVTPALTTRHGEASSLDAYDGSTTVAQWREQCEPSEASPATSRGHWRGALAAIAAGVVACGILLAWTLPWGSRNGAVSAGSFDTRSGEHLHLLLADGSQVTLGADSRLRVDFSSQRRSLQLQAGEAYFLVAKDKSRPFEVHAMDSSITAVGTAFNVRAIEDRVTVTVTEGTVRVAEPGVTSAAPLRLQHGQQISYRPADAAVIGPDNIKQVDAAESARWRDGWLVYRDEPLQIVIADVARYTNLKFAVTAPAAKLQFSGAVFKDRIEEWIAALPEVSPVVVERRGDEVTIGMRRSELVQSE